MSTRNYSSPYQPKSTPTPTTKSIKTQNRKSSPYDASGASQLKTAKTYK